MNSFSASLDGINLIRQELGISRWKNIAVAEYQLEKDYGSVVATSGRATRPGTVGLPRTPVFQTFSTPPGHSRRYEA